MSAPEQNEIVDLAWDVINNTSLNLFLTGKAGTGKTTFLKYVLDHTGKNAAVVAPTGVAAMNAGGVTIHSMFQLPFLPFLPEYNTQEDQIQFVNRYSLFRGMRLSKEKIELLRELDLLIIDEVSMVRADVLDMIDESLRHFRNRKNVAFGGVQVLFIGDLYQLPPVVKDSDWSVQKKYYASPYFFSAKTMETCPMLFLELKKIYRQSEEQFIRILNGIRNNRISQADLDELNKRCVGGNGSGTAKGITLVTHNAQADRINQHELQKLETTLHTFTADVHGTFPESANPCEAELQLKAGAQVMFIRNDPDKRYVNGTIAFVKEISDEGISVELRDDKKTIALQRGEWKNIRYKLNKETGKVEEEEIGSFTQYPLRLAWAVTIHKSQGLTFDEVTLDVEKSFASGQVYVALSRCRTLNGITLLSRISTAHIFTDAQISEFSKGEHKPDELTGMLEGEKKKYAARILIRAFDWGKIKQELELWGEALREWQKQVESPESKAFSLILDHTKHHATISEKFVAELEKKLVENPLNEVWLVQKVVGAKKYFIERILKEILSPLEEIRSQLKGKKGFRKLGRQLAEVESYLESTIHLIEKASFGNLALEVVKTEVKKGPAASRKKPARGESKLETLALYKEGKNAEQIARHRDMAVSTIEGHLAALVANGEVNISDFIPEVLLETIKAAANKAGDNKLSSIKHELGEAASYTQIRMVLNHLHRMKEAR
ncbi:MAG: helix-turn-helix domain-containing protein [Bacteroidia bacterium]